MIAKKNKLYTVFMILLLLVWCAAMIGWGVMQATFKGTRNLEGWGGLYLEDWEWVEPDGTRRTIDLPAEFDTSVGNLAVIEKVLPDHVPGDAVFALISRKNTAVYVDGEERFYTTNEDTLYPGGRMKMRQYQIPLGPEDSGKVVRVEFWGETTQNGQIGHVYYGNTYGIFRSILEKEGWVVLAASPLLLISLLLIPVGIVLYKLFKSGYSISFLGMGIATIISWIICDNIIYQYIFQTYDIDGILTFIFPMLIPFPFICYLNIEQRKRYQKWLACLLAFNFAYVSVITFLHFSEIASFRDTMSFMNLMLALNVVAILVDIVVDHLKGNGKEYRMVTIGLCGLSGFGILEIVALNFFSTRQISELFTILGLYFLVVMAILNMFRQIRIVKLKAQDAVRANEYKTGFLANMSHEIRTPINAILGMNTMILREADNEEIREYATNVDNAGHTLLSLVNEILDISKIEAGKMELVEESYYLNDLLQEVIPLIKIKADEKKLLFKLDIDPELPGVLYGDKVRICQIMLNILNNAVKYTPRGSVLFKVFGSGEEEFRLEFDVADTGKGIREEAIPTLFDAFKRIDEKSNRNIEGTGLGLSITKNFVDMMGGEITVESEYGKGSVFHVEIPQGRISDTPIGEFRLVSTASSNREEKKSIYVVPDKKVLVVDDMVVNQKVFCALLKRTKVQIDCASSGQECLEAIRRKKYDLIFLDHMMPGMDGIETFRVMKQDQDNQCTDTPVIMLTANAIVGAKNRYIQEGFTDYLTKPISGDTLEQMLKKYLGGEETVVVSPVQKEIELPVLREFDLEYAMNVVRDKKFLMHMLEETAFSMEAIRRRLQDAIDHVRDRDGLTDYHLCVHSLKNSAENVGALLLAKLARLVEIAVIEEDIDRVLYEHPLLMEELDMHIDTLRQEFPVRE